jgi:hypothetical protein
MRRGETMSGMTQPLDWDDDNHAYRDRAHYHAYERSDGKWGLPIYSMLTDEPNQVEERLDEYVLDTESDAKVVAQALADQRGSTW